MLLAVNELWRFLVVSPHGPPSLPSRFWTADRIRELLNHAALTSGNNYHEPEGPPSLMRYMFWAVGRRGCLKKAKQGASPPPTHVRAKETALRRQEKKFSLFSPIVWFFFRTVYSDEPWWVEHKSFFIKNYWLGQEILHYRQMSQFKLTGYVLYTQRNRKKKEVSNTDNVGISESKGI